MGIFHRYKARPAIAALALMAPTPIQAETEHPRSYYPTLTRADVRVCRPQFAALQADVVEHFRLSAAAYAPGGQSYKTNPAAYADGANVRVYTQQKNEVAAKDPLSFYVDGLMGSGEMVGGLDGINEYWDEESASGRLNSTPDVQPASYLRYGLSRPHIEAPAEKCVARVWTKKFQAMHATLPPSKGETAIPPLRQAVMLEAHNPANEATACVRGIRKPDFEEYGVKSVMGAVFRNQCPHPVDITWCTDGRGGCAKGYNNLMTLQASSDRGFSYDLPAPGVAFQKVKFGACRKGFVGHQGELSKKMTHSCK